MYRRNRRLQRAQRRDADEQPLAERDYELYEALNMLKGMYLLQARTPAPSRHHDDRARLVGGSRLVGLHRGRRRPAADRDHHRRSRLPTAQRSRRDRDRGARIVRHTPVHSRTGARSASSSMPRARKSSCTCRWRPISRNELLGPGALMIGMSEDEFIGPRRMPRWPHYRRLAAVNNHMGSLLTADPERMRWLMSVTRGLSCAAISSTAEPPLPARARGAAAAAAVPYLARDVFLDNERDVAGHPRPPRRFD
jgi:hypothetical protein